MATVRKLIDRVFPNGTRGAGEGRCDQIPLWPPDVFVAVATLVERSGAYQYVVAPGDETERGGPLGIRDPKALEALRKMATAWAYGLMNTWDRAEQNEETLKNLGVLFGDDLRSLSAEEMAEWKKGREPDDVYYSWDDLTAVVLSPLREDWQCLVGKFADWPVVPAPSADSDHPEWWKAALRLLIAADMACGGVGFIRRLRPGRPGSQPNWVQSEVIAQLVRPKGTNEKSDYVFVGDPSNTLTSSVVNSAMAAVLPKTRTATIGCTLRSLTHHLALLPSPGRVSARWVAQSERIVPAVDYPSEDIKGKPLTLLLIPFPFHVNPASFETRTFKDEKGWGYFHLRQDWLTPYTPHKGAVDQNSKDLARSQIVEFVKDLAVKAAAQMGEVNGVIFPEYSMNDFVFSKVSSALRERTDLGFEFIVAGLSDEPNANDDPTWKGREGNFVAFRGLSRRAEDGKVADTDRWAIQGAREKHHRWKLSKGQIKRYALSHKLDPETTWWEGIPIPPRRVEFYEVRAGTTMTALVCEDLARVDPCQEVIRAVGPNLVIALLMDGPQKASRWPGHYAGVLADDPGSSVLTLSSMALIARGGVTDNSHSRSIAFFKDCQAVERELQLPVGYHALAVRLTASKKNEHTLDGRGDGGTAYIWNLQDVCPIRADLQPGSRWIVDGAKDRT